jgi:hypothetical protein
LQARLGKVSLAFIFIGGFHGAVSTLINLRKTAPDKCVEENFGEGGEINANSRVQR